MALSKAREMSSAGRDVIRGRRLLGGSLSLSLGDGDGGVAT